MTIVARPSEHPSVQYLLRVGDTCLIQSHRLAEWCGHAPAIEEDIALANIALDLLGQARLLLTRAGQIDGQGHSEDQLAFLRSEHDFRNLTLVELPRGDFADTIFRNLVLSTFLRILWGRLLSSSDPQVLALAGKAIKEVAYHQRHAADWLIRFGHGTVESRRRLQQAVDVLWPYTAEMFEADDIDVAADTTALGPDWSDMREEWTDAMTAFLDDAGLEIPRATGFRSAGKQGRHSEHLGLLLCVMQSLPRMFPGAAW